MAFTCFFHLSMIPFIAASYINDATAQGIRRWKQASVRLFLHSRTETVCIFFMFFGINKISGILSANLVLPFGGDDEVVIEGSNFEDGLQANRSVFPLHGIL